MCVCVCVCVCVYVCIGGGGGDLKSALKLEYFISRSFCPPVGNSCIRPYPPPPKGWLMLHMVDTALNIFVHLWSLETLIKIALNFSYLNRTCNSHTHTRTHTHATHIRSRQVVSSVSCKLGSAVSCNWYMTITRNQFTLEQNSSAVLQQHTNTRCVRWRWSLHWWWNRGKLRGSASHSRLVLVLVNHHCEINPASPSPVYSTNFGEDLSCLNQKTDAIQTSLLPSFLRAEV